jgi:hypothetical protein
MTTTEFFDYLCEDQRTRDLGAELRALVELRRRVGAATTGTATPERVPIAAA